MRELYVNVYVCDLDLCLGYWEILNLYVICDEVLGYFLFYIDYVWRIMIFWDRDEI